MDYVIGVSHKKDDSRRRESLKRIPYHFVEDTPGHHSVWAPRMWEKALSYNEDYCVFLQDDVTAEDPYYFGRYCLNEIVCLHTPNPKFTAAYQAGYDWATSIDGMVGNGYIFPSPILKELLEFRRFEFWPEVLTELNEDAQIALFAMATDRRIWHPLPSPIDHDTSLPSTWGADHHPHRRPCVPWGTPRKVHGKGTCSVGRIYPAEHWRLLTHIKPGYPELLERAYAYSKL